MDKTPLFSLHVQLGAKMVPFAGYEMPIQYKSGTLHEHLHTRKACGVFDVSHMGQIVIRPQGDDSIDDIAVLLESLTPVDLVSLGIGRQSYALFTDDHGGILDDLMIAKRRNDLLLVVNAANKHDDFAYLQAQIGSQCELELIEHRSLIAVQGPASERLLRKLISNFPDMGFMDVVELTSAFGSLWISRSGYTGEDGFEISLPDDGVEGFVRQLLDDDEARMIGLGARDTLRLEAGLCLYGNDLTRSTTIIEAGLLWSVSKSRRPGNEKAGGFPGHEVLQKQLNDGVRQKRTGLKPIGRVPIRRGQRIYDRPTGGTEVGSVTSGAFGATIDGPVAMGYLAPELIRKKQVVYCEGRRERQPVEPHAARFVENSFVRK